MESGQDPGISGLKYPVVFQEVKDARAQKIGHYAYMTIKFDRAT